MSWLSKIANSAVDAGKRLNNMTNEALSLAEEWQNKDKSFIHDKYKNGNTIERMAATKVAKDNGWKK